MVESQFSLSDEHSIFAELDNKRPMLDIHKNPLLVSILQGCEILREMTDKNMLPPEIMEQAKGFLIMKTDKVGLGISIIQGHGLVIQKAPDRPSGCFGAVIGFSEQLTLLALADEKEIDAFKAEKRSMKLGVDIGLSLQDKFDMSRSINPVEAIQTRVFTISKGMLVDFAFKGTSVEANMDDIEDSYGKKVTPADILNGTVTAPREALLLYKYLRILQLRQLLEELTELLMLVAALVFASPPVAVGEPSRVPAAASTATAVRGAEEAVDA
eukprot:gene10209-8126_t